MPSKRVLPDPHRRGQIEIFPQVILMKNKNGRMYISLLYLHSFLCQQILKTEVQPLFNIHVF